MDTFSYAIQDGDGAKAYTTLKITVTGANDAPIVSAAKLTGAVTEQITPNGNLTDSGSLAFADVDLSDVHTIAAMPVGATLGTLSVSKDADTTGSGAGGALTWTYSVADSTVEFLAAGQTKLEQFTVSVNDGHGGVAQRTVSVTVTGTNDAPVIGTANLTAGLTEMGTPVGNLTASNTIAFGDVDLTDVHTASVTPTGTTLGTLTATKTTDTTGSGTGGVVTWNYSVAAAALEYLAAGQTKIETFTVSVDDAHGGVAQRTVSVTITGTNDLPLAQADSFVATEDTLLSGNLATNDQPSGDGGNVWSKASDAAHGTVVVRADGTFTYVPSANYNGPDSFSYTLTDANGDTSTAVASISVTAVNDPPVAQNDHASVVAGESVAIPVLANDSDVDGNTLSVSKIAGIAVVPGSKVTLPQGVVTINADGSLSSLANPDVQGDVVFSYEASDGQGGTATAQVTVAVAPAAVTAPPVPTPELAAPVLTPAAGVSTERAPLSGGEQAREPSVFYDGSNFDRILRLPIPFHPATFINGIVEGLQKERTASDSATFSDPRIEQYGDVQSTSIGTGLGLDPTQYVTQAVHDSRDRAAQLDHVVNGRLGRINLSSDRALPTPELFRPDIPQAAPPVEPAPPPQREQSAPLALSDTDVSTEPQVVVAARVAPVRRTALSFTEQLRGATTRTALAHPDKLRHQVTLDGKYTHDHS